MTAAAAKARPKTAWSLRRLLLTGILLPVLALIALNAWSLYQQTLASLHTAYDRTLLASAKSISEQIGVTGYDEHAQLRAIGSALLLLSAFWANARRAVVGPLPAAGARFDVKPVRIARAPGLYCALGFGARGLAWGALAGELLASQICGEPLPVERDLAEACDPARFGWRAARQLAREKVKS